MASRRVTKKVKEAVARDLVDQATMKRIAAFDRFTARVAKRLWMHLHSKKDRELMDRAPDGAFATKGIFHLYLHLHPENHNRSKEGVYVGQKFYAGWGWHSTRKAEVQYPVFACFGQSSSVDQNELPKELLEQIRECEQEREALNAHRHEMFREVKGLLEAFNTTKQIEENWPEIMPVVQKHLPPAPAQVPAVRFEEMNKLLGIGGSE